MIMPAALAKKIVKEFEAVVEQVTSQYPVALPDNVLPHPKEKIKEAIKAHATHLKAAKKLTVAVGAELRALFVTLGRFTDPEEAEFVKKYNNSLATEVNAGFAEKTKRSQFVTNKVRIQEENHVQDFRVFLSRLMNDKILGSRSE